MVGWSMQWATALCEGGSVRIVPSSSCYNERKKKEGAEIKNRAKTVKGGKRQRGEC